MIPKGLCGCLTLAFIMVGFELQPCSWHLFLHVTCTAICVYAGTEWQYWLLFYSLPLLSGILPNVYYLHYCALVCAIATLVSGNISEADLDMASILLKEFHRHAGDLYGKISDFAVDINTGILSTLVNCLRLLFISRYCYANNECPPTTSSSVQCQKLGAFMVLLMLRV